MRNTALIFLVIFISTISSCKKDEESETTEMIKTVPTLINTRMSNNFQIYEFTVLADIKDNGNSKIISKGVCYDTRPNPTSQIEI